MQEGQGDQSQRTDVGIAQRIISTSHIEEESNVVDCHPPIILELFASGCFRCCGDRCRIATAERRRKDWS